MSPNILADSAMFTSNVVLYNCQKLVSAKDAAFCHFHPVLPYWENVQFCCICKRKQTYLRQFLQRRQKFLRLFISSIKKERQLQLGNVFFSKCRFNGQKCELGASLPVPAPSPPFPLSPPLSLLIGVRGITPGICLKLKVLVGEF